MRLASALRDFIAPQPLPDGAEPFEYPVISGDFGDKMPDVDAFLDWCERDLDMTGFVSIQAMRVNHDAFARITQRRPLSDRQLACLVSKSDRIHKWRDRRAGNATRYKIVSP